MQPQQPRPVDAALRDLLTASVHARAGLARRLAMGLREVEAVEHVMTAPPGQVPGPVELARLLGVTTAASTQLLHRLEDDGHVERVPREDDRRRVALQVTDSGRDHVLSELVPMLAALSEVAGRLTPQEAAVVERYLREVEAVFHRFA